MPAVLALVPTVLSLLGGLFKTHSSATNTSTPIPGWITAIENLIGGAATLSPFTSLSNDVGNAATLLTDIVTNGQGLIPPAWIAAASVANNALSKFTATAKDYVEGQVAIEDDNFEFEGVAGVQMALAKSAFANPIPPGVTTIGGALGLV